MFTLAKAVTRGIVEPPTFRFSGVGITVRRIPLTSAICANTLIRTPMNRGERRWMRPKTRPPGTSCLEQTLRSWGVRYRARLPVAGPSSWPTCSSRRWCQSSNSQLLRGGFALCKAIDMGSRCTLRLPAASKGQQRKRDSPYRSLVLTALLGAWVASIIALAPRRQSPLTPPMRSGRSSPSERQSSDMVSQGAALEATVDGLGDPCPFPPCSFVAVF
jgi:hypothetical protein